MVTTLERDGLEIKIAPDAPIVMIGEKINPTGHKKLSEALEQRNFDYVRELAERQIDSGAHILDVNASIPGADEAKLLPEVVKIVAERAAVPLCIDSNSVDALEAALKVCPGKPLVNSVNGEKAKLERVLPLVRDRGAALVGQVGPAAAPMPMPRQSAPRKRVRRSVARVQPSWSSAGEKDCMRPRRAERGATACASSQRSPTRRTE